MVEIYIQLGFAWLIYFQGEQFCMKECTCLFRIGFSQAISRPSIFSDNRWFSQCSNVPCVCKGWVFHEVTGWFGVIRLVLMFYLSYCVLSLCFPNVGFTSCELTKIHDIWFVLVLSLRSKKLLIFLVFHKMINIIRLSVRVFSMFIKLLLSFIKKLVHMEYCVYGDPPFRGK